MGFIYWSIQVLERSNDLRAEISSRLPLVFSIEFCFKNELFTAIQDKNISL